MEHNLPSLEPFFEQMYLSYEIGLRKPDAQIFEYVLQDAGLDPSKTLFIDDTIQHIQSAKEVGLITHHLVKKSIVELYKVDGKLYGKIIYLFPREGREDDPKCKKCTDDLKDQPLVGLQIVRSLKWDGEEWEGGTIVDPEIGKIYTVKMWLVEGNANLLNVRGYIGPLYRTQKWVRVE